ncbi:MAG: glycosyltransferase family 39 protein, partial [Deltaproteobacteria bacterium]|nr:glycosyltransferase family 39 protein [Deltaproteobacteria bacterium]
MSRRRKRSRRRGERRILERLRALLSVRNGTLLLAALACAYLGRIVYTTTWTMDADEAVHSIEGLRLYDHLARGEIGAFVRDTYFPERWAPPVHDHLRWYPFVHAWCLVPFFAALGPEDFAARLPSVLLLFGTAVIFFDLGRRLSRRPAASGFLAVVLLLGAPNLLTFSAQSLIATASLFTCYLALLLYVRSLAADHAPKPALLAGLALGLAMLTKYDHGGILAISLGLSELARARYSLPRFFRSGAPLLFGAALLPVVIWFAHPAKLQILSDSAGHPFYGTPRLILFDFVMTWFAEYGASLAVGGLALLSFAGLIRRRSEPAIRILLIWGTLSMLFYASRGRFHFRYHLVEAPIFLLAAAVVVPGWIEWVARFVASANTRRRHLLAGAAWLLSACVIFVGLRIALRPVVLFDSMRAPFEFFHGLRVDRWGMRLEPGAYVDYFAQHYGGFASYLGGSLAALAAGVFLLASGSLYVALGFGTVRSTRALCAAALALAILPGIGRLYQRLPDMVDWELECHPELGEVYAFVRANGGAEGTTLLGGGWDQLTNNSLRWYLITGSEPLPAFGDVHVVGDMIGSLVFPPEERIAYWTEQLATAATADLPDRIVLVEPEEGFLYRTRIGPEVELYRTVLAARGSHVSVATRSFPALGCRVEVLRVVPDSEPVAAPRERMQALGVLGDSVAESSRTFVNDDGWVLKDESLRHF